MRSRNRHQRGAGDAPRRRPIVRCGCDLSRASFAPGIRWPQKFRSSSTTGAAAKTDGCSSLAVTRKGRLRFAFSQPQLYVRAGEQARLKVKIDAPLPRPGEEVERGFTVVCNDGTDESETTGSLVQTASTSPITTARLRLEPERVVVRNRRRGSFRVTVDNVRGSLPLRVWLSGSDPEGAVRFTFTPAQLDVPPGDIGRSVLRVEASLPGSGREADREDPGQRQRRCRCS